MTSKQTYYNVLGIKPEASTSEVSEAYKSRVKAFYADEKFLKENNVQIQDILIAYEILSNSNKRREYDRCLGVKKQSDDVLIEVSYQEENTEEESDDNEHRSPIERDKDSRFSEASSLDEEALKDWIPSSKSKKRKKAPLVARIKQVKDSEMKQKTEKIVLKDDYKNESDFKIALDKQIEKFNSLVEKYCTSQKNLRKTFVLNKKKRTEMKSILCTNRDLLLKQYEKYDKSLSKYIAATVVSIENMHTKKSNLRIYENNSKKASLQCESGDSRLYSKKHYSKVCKELKKREKQTNAEVKQYKKQDEVFKEYIAYIKAQTN